MSSKGKFRSKGSDILKSRPPTPGSIHAFLANGEPAAKTDHNHPPPVTQLHKGPLAHQPNCTNRHYPPETSSAGTKSSLSPTQSSENLVRLHVQVRQDLADRLLEKVFQLKRRAGCQKKAASQRSIIEAALEAYFEQERKGPNKEP